MHPEHDNSPQPFETYADQSPDTGSVPFWVTACVRLLTPGPPRGKSHRSADKVITVAQMLDADRIKVSGEAAVTLDRDAIAAIAGYDGTSQASNARWITQFLERIGYLRINQRREAGTGRRLPDEFTVSPRPPANYVGPRTLAGVVRALQENRPWQWEDLFLQVSATDASARVGSEPTHASARVGSFSQVSATDASARVGSEPFNSKESFASRSERSEAFASLKEAAASLRGASGGFPNEAEVREMVRTAPWKEAGHVITHAELDVVVPFVADAMQRYGLSLVQAQEHLDGKIGKLTSRNAVKRIEYVVRGFRDYLPEHVTTPDAAAAPGEQRSLAASEAPKKASKIHQEALKGVGEGKESDGAGATPQKRSQGENRPVVPPAPTPPSDEEVADPETVRSYLASIRSFTQEKNRRRRRQERDRALQGLEPEQAVADSAADGEQAG